MGIAAIIMPSKSTFALTSLLALSNPFTAAAYVTYTHSPCRSTAIGAQSSMLPVRRRGFFSRDTFKDLDYMIDSMFADAGSMFLEPPSLQLPRPSYLLQRVPTRALARRAPRATYQTIQDGKDVKVIVKVPGADPNGISLQLDDENRLLSISGKTIYEEQGIAVSSKFERTFRLARDVDMSKVSAEFADGGILKITAPKVDQKENAVRTLAIDVIKSLPKTEEAGEVEVDQKEVEDTAAAHYNANPTDGEVPKEVKSQDESIINLDESAD